MKYKAVVIGSSAGGLEALRTILSALPGDFLIPVIIVQHLNIHSEIKEQGGIAIVQDPEIAEAPMMPKAAIEATSVDYILELEEIGKLLIRLQYH